MKSFPARCSERPSSRQTSTLVAAPGRSSDASSRDLLRGSSSASARSKRVGATLAIIWSAWDLADPPRKCDRPLAVGLRRFVVFRSAEPTELDALAAPDVRSTFRSSRCSSRTGPVNHLITAICSAWAWVRSNRRITAPVLPAMPASAPEDDEGARARTGRRRAPDLGVRCPSSPVAIEHEGEVIGTGVWPRSGPLSVC